MREAFVGFDSAWSGTNKGGLVWASFDGSTLIECHGPQPADFEDALSQIQSIEQEHDYLLVAIDQPTIVPNRTGYRPVEGVARSLIGGRLKSAVQPAFREKESMFGKRAPIWNFLTRLEDGQRGRRAIRQNPHAARTEPTGSFLIEVYPALTLPAWLPVTLTRERPPKGIGGEKSSGSRPVGYAARYNPELDTFTVGDWRMVGLAVSDLCDRFSLSVLSEWVRKAIESDSEPKKAEQDQMDAVICLLIALMWRRDDAERLALLGDRQNGYMATPVSKETRKILEEGASKGGFSCPPEPWDSDADHVPDCLLKK